MWTKVNAREAREIPEWMNCSDLNVLRVRILSETVKWYVVLHQRTCSIKAQNTVVSRISPGSFTVRRLGNRRFPKMVQWLLEWQRYIPSDEMSDLSCPLMITRCENSTGGGKCYHDSGPVGLGGCVLWLNMYLEVFCMSMTDAGRMQASPVDQPSPEQLWRKWKIHEITKSSSAFNWCINGLIKCVWRFRLDTHVSLAASEITHSIIQSLT